MTNARGTERIVRKLENLPTLPIVAIRLGELIHARNVTVKQVVDVLRSDPSMCANLLRLVNSPYYGIPGGVTDVARAVPFLGFNTLHQLVLSLSVLQLLGGTRGIRGLWIHSLSVAVGARELAVEVGASDPGQCFTAGLLHDVGKIAIARAAPDEFASARTLIQQGMAVWEAEARYGLAAHDRVGSMLARKWRFPAALTSAIEHHHTIHRPEARACMSASQRTIAELVAYADHAARGCTSPTDDDPCDEDGELEIEDLCERTGLSLAQRGAVSDRTRQQLEKSTELRALLDA